MNEINSQHKSNLLQGGAYLAIKQILTTALSLVSVLVVARTLGPEDYGIVSVVLGLYYFLSWIGKFGLPIYLIRQQNLQEDAFQQVLSFFNTAGLVTCFLCWVAAPAFGWLTGHSEVVSIIRWLPLPLWLEAVASVSISRQERDLGFAQIGVIETVSQTSNYIVTVPLVFMQWGYWAPIAGLVAQAAVLAIAARRLHSIPFRWRWNWRVIQPALRYGLTFSGSDWIASLRVLTVPLIITRFAGIEAAGIISIAIRLVEQVSTLRLVLRRMSISIMSKFIDDAYMVKKAISYGMAYQAIIVGLTCAIFACCAGSIVPLIFGKEWLLSSKIFPLVAFSMLVKSTFDLHNSVLYVIGKNLEVAWRNFIYIVLLWLGCILFIPSLNLWGYGIAEIFALPSYLLIHRALVTLYGSLDYGRALWFTVAAIPPLVAGSYLPIGLSLGVLFGSYGFLLFIPSARKVIFEIWAIVRPQGAKTEA